MSYEGKYGRGRWARNKETASYLGVTVMTLWRWKRTERLHFPLAALVNNIEHNDLNAIDAWMRSRVVDRTVTVGTEEEAAA
jgi:predicted DNA-binding transcriptional regulator AlpA